MGNIRLKRLAGGVASYMPGYNQLRRPRTRGTDTARYCYSIWLRHLTCAQQAGLWNEPKVVAELGPGDSLGIGLAALLTGCETYFAFDIVPYANSARNLEIFDRLVGLFERREALPDDREFPRVEPRLADYRFPHGLLPDARLATALRPERLRRIRESIADPERAGAMVRYVVPWLDASVLEPHSVDMIFSQAVLEHIDDLPATYNALHAWLKPTGFMSHTIDFTCHGTAREWNGHWVFSDLTWKLIRGRRPWLLNRQPHSVHARLLRETGFTVRQDAKVTARSRIKRDDVASRFRGLSDDDLETSGTFILALP